MTDRPTASTINDVQLDALYDRLDRVRNLAAYWTTTGQQPGAAINMDEAATALLRELDGPGPVVSVHGARDLNPEAREAVDALLAVAKRQITEDDQATAGASKSHIYLSSGCHPTHEHEHLPNGQTGHQYCESMTGLNGAKRPGECKHCGAKCQCPNHQPGPADTRTEPARQTKEQ